MKKLFIATLIVATFVTNAYAEPVKVNRLVVSNFSAEFKDASQVSWASTSEYVKASFVSDRQKMEAFYTPSGEKIGTSRGIGIEELPTSAKRAFAKKYGNYNVKEAILFEGTEESAYFISAENDAENVIVKIFDDGSISVFKKTKK